MRLHWFDGFTTLALVTFGGTAAGQTTLTVRTCDYAGIPAAEWQAASTLARDVLLKAAIPTEWVLTTPDKLTARPVGDGDVFINLVPHSMEGGYTASALGHTLLPGNGRQASQIYIFHERIVDSAHDRRIDPARLLGYAMAHELGHALLGTGQHSQTGVMRERWTRADFDEIATGRLEFTARQAGKLAAALTARMAAAADATGGAGASKGTSGARPAAAIAAPSARAGSGYR